VRSSGWRCVESIANSLSPLVGERGESAFRAVSACFGIAGQPNERIIADAAARLAPTAQVSDGRGA